MVNTSPSQQPKPDGRAFTANGPLLSIVVPAFNELSTLALLIENLRTQIHEQALEVLIVDDGSTDGTADFIRQLSDERIRVISHATNQGKGAALRTGFENVKGHIIVIQDADLEYDPKDIPSLIQPILDNHADVVFGSRFHGSEQRIHLYWHRVANSWLTRLSNLFNNLDLSDMETGYKAFDKSVLDKIRIRENGFGVEPELTAKVAKLKCRVYEVPISYYGRDYSQGKKIGFRDAVWAVCCIVRYRFSD
jgi:glycosyltransferase involved in cell wall biosynthesis